MQQATPVPTTMKTSRDWNRQLQSMPSFHLMLCCLNCASICRGLHISSTFSFRWIPDTDTGVVHFLREVLACGLASHLTQCGSASSCRRSRDGTPHVCIVFSGLLDLPFRSKQGRTGRRSHHKLDIPSFCHTCGLESNMKSIS